MKQKPRWTLEMLTASLAVLCGLLVLVLLIQRPTAWPVLLALVFWLIVAILRSVNRRRAKKRAMRARRPGARQGREDRRG